MGCLFWPELSLSVRSELMVGVCAGLKEGVTLEVEFWVEASASVLVWRGTSARGRSFGLRPLFLPVVAPFLTSALIPLSSSALLLLLETTWVAAARNQFWEKNTPLQIWAKYKSVYTPVQLSYCVCNFISSAVQEDRINKISYCGKEKLCYKKDYILNTQVILLPCNQIVCQPHCICGKNINMMYKSGPRS